VLVDKEVKNEKAIQILRNSSGCKLNMNCKTSCKSWSGSLGSFRGGYAPLNKLSSPSPYQGEGDKGDRVT